ncbi:hypothetical protein HK104_004672, partial [Borealophlyctis nickersoniae]
DDPHVWSIRMLEEEPLRSVLEWSYFSRAEVDVTNWWKVLAVARRLMVQGLVDFVEKWVQCDMVQSCGGMVADVGGDRKRWAVAFAGAAKAERKIGQEAITRMLNVAMESEGPGSEFQRYQFIRDVVRDTPTLNPHEVETLFSPIRFSSFSIGELEEAYSDPILPRQVIAGALMTSLKTRAEDSFLKERLILGNAGKADSGISLESSDGGSKQMESPEGTALSNGQGCVAGSRRNSMISPDPLNAHTEPVTANTSPTRPPLDRSTTALPSSVSPSRPRPAVTRPKSFPAAGHLQVYERVMAQYLSDQANYSGTSTAGHPSDSVRRSFDQTMSSLQTAEDAFFADSFESNDTFLTAPQGDLPLPYPENEPPYPDTPATTFSRAQPNEPPYPDTPAITFSRAQPNFLDLSFSDPSPMEDLREVRRQLELLLTRQGPHPMHLQLEPDKLKPPPAVRSDTDTTLLVPVDQYPYQQTQPAPPHVPDNLIKPQQQQQQQQRHPNLQNGRPDTPELLNQVRERLENIAHPGSNGSSDEYRMDASQTKISADGNATVRGRRKKSVGFLGVTHVQGEDGDVPRTPDMAARLEVIKHGQNGEPGYADPYQYPPGSDGTLAQPSVETLSFNLDGLGNPQGKKKSHSSDDATWEDLALDMDTSDETNSVASVHPRMPTSELIERIRTAKIAAQAITRGTMRRLPPNAAYNYATVRKSKPSEGHRTRIPEEKARAVFFRDMEKDGQDGGEWSGSEETEGSGGQVNGRGREQQQQTDQHQQGQNGRRVSPPKPLPQIPAALTPGQLLGIRSHSPAAITPERSPRPDRRQLTPSQGQSQQQQQPRPGHPVMEMSDPPPRLKHVTSADRIPAWESSSSSSGTSGNALGGATLRPGTSREALAALAALADDDQQHTHIPNNSSDDSPTPSSSSSNPSRQTWGPATHPSAVGAGGTVGGTFKMLNAKHMSFAGDNNNDPVNGGGGSTLRIFEDGLRTIGVGGRKRKGIVGFFRGNGL